MVLQRATLLPFLCLALFPSVVRPVSAAVRVQGGTPAAVMVPAVGAVVGSALGASPLTPPSAPSLGLPAPMTVLPSVAALPSPVAPEAPSAAAAVRSAARVPAAVRAVPSAVAVSVAGRAASSDPGEDLPGLRGRPSGLGRHFQALRRLFGVGSGTDLPGAGADAPVAAAAARFEGQISSMGSELRRPNDPLLAKVRRYGLDALRKIADHASQGLIAPQSARIRTSAEEPPAPVVDRELRIGVYPVAADPFQWAHMLIGLNAMAELKLDKVVFVLAGDDPRKPGMTKADFRHAMGRAVLGVFGPLFGYSSIAVGTQFDGETNIFRILSLNPAQSIQAFYIVGGDHYRLKDKNGNDDTLLKIQKKLETPGLIDRSRHSVSLAFVERDEPLDRIATPLDVHFLKDVGFEASSTLVRNGRYELMPYAAYDYVRAHRPGLYGIGEPVAR